MVQQTVAGVRSSMAIAAMVERNEIQSMVPLAGDQIQPASLDLRLGAKVWRVRASFLPGPRAKVEEQLASMALHHMDLTHGAVLETGCVYVAEIEESLALPETVHASTNPKSSTGRIDVFTRVITDHAQEFDTIESGYQGWLYAEISPRTFPVLVRRGSRLSQIRFKSGLVRLDDGELKALHEKDPLVDAAKPSLQGGLAVSVDLSGFGKEGLIGYRARRFTGLVDVDSKGLCKIADYWEPLYADSNRALILDPGHFYILASKESVRVPPLYAAEMVPFDPLVGEFRVHYAGFFDPGFGHEVAGGHGARAVLEVRSRDVPFRLEDGQIVGRLVYERLSERPLQLYGETGSHYQAQALKLSKHFA
jgi:dCTP deaminase